MAIEPNDKIQNIKFSIENSTDTTLTKSSGNSKSRIVVTLNDSITTQKVVKIAGKLLKNETFFDAVKRFFGFSVKLTVNIESQLTEVVLNVQSVAKRLGITKAAILEKNFSLINYLNNPLNSDKLNFEETTNTPVKNSSANVTQVPTNELAQTTAVTSDNSQINNPLNQGGEAVTLTPVEDSSASVAQLSANELAQKTAVTSDNSQINNPFSDQVNNLLKELDLNNPIKLHDQLKLMKKNNKADYDLLSKSEPFKQKIADVVLNGKEDIRGCYILKWLIKDYLKSNDDPMLHLNAAQRLGIVENKKLVIQAIKTGGKTINLPDRDIQASWWSSVNEFLTFQYSGLNVLLKEIIKDFCKELTGDDLINFLAEPDNMLPVNDISEGLVIGNHGLKRYVDEFKKELIKLKLDKIIKNPLLLARVKEKISQSQQGHIETLSSIIQENLTMFINFFECLDKNATKKRISETDKKTIEESFEIILKIAGAESCGFLHTKYENNQTIKEIFNAKVFSTYGEYRVVKL